MQILRAYGFCSYCRTHQPAVKLVPNYTVHAALTMMTFGLWSIVWFITAIYNHFWIGWRCEICGRKL